MNTAPDKVMALSDAIERFVEDGSHISIGGFTINRNPMAAVYEIIRQRKKKLHLYAHSNGQGADELIGGGCLAKLEIAYSGTGRFGPTGIRFKKAVEGGTLPVEDYTNFQMTLRFLAGALGIPFLPTRSSLGTDIIEKWGFPADMRASDPKIPNEKLLVIDNPFGTWINKSKLVLVPAIQTDVTIVHVQKADRQGTARIKGLTFADVEQIKSARIVILTCEDLVETDELRVNSDGNQIPPFCVDAVVHVPFGAYPTACYGYYDYDPVYLKQYAAAAVNEEAHGGYLARFIHGVPDHARFLQIAAGSRLDELKADPRTGYAPNLNRS
jgi:glutaconate CoA-transferase, subunit A